MLDDIIRKVCDADEVHFEGKMRLTLSFASKAELECVRMRRSSSLRVEIARNLEHKYETWHATTCKFGNLSRRWQ